MAPYITDMLTNYTPVRSLRSSSKGLLTVQRVNSNFAFAAFSHHAPTLWYSLPPELRSVTVYSFKSRL